MKNIHWVREEDKQLKIRHQLQTVLVLADMFQRLVLIHHRNRTTQDGPYLKLVELLMIENVPIEIKLTIQDQLLAHKLIQRIELDKKHILDQVIVLRQISLEHSRTKCREDLV